MAATFRLIADALAAGLQAATLPAGVTVTRANWIELDAADMAAPVVIVTPGSAEASRVATDITQFDYTANVFVARHCDTNAEVDSAIDLADAVMRYVRAHQWPQSSAWPAGVTGPISTTIEINPDDGLTERNIWRAMILATYRVFDRDALA
jgi:hypothetical protein